MNFYASRAYLETVAKVYFPGRQTAVEDVRISEKVLRLLVVDKRRVITNVNFLDYHEPLLETEIDRVSRRHHFAASVAQEVISYDTWKQGGFDGQMPAPFVDWSLFATYDEYQNHIKPRGKDLLREAARRRRRLADEFGELSFRMDDTEEDVFRLAMQWKSAQLRETGLPDYFAEPQNVEFFHELRRRNLLTASTLRAADRLLSAWLGFVHDGVWSGWIFTYDHDPALKKYSVGRQLLHSMLEQGYREKHRQFDFSAGDEAYKWLYSTHVRLLRPLGQPALRRRIALRTKAEAKKVFARYPKALEAAQNIARKLRSKAVLSRKTP